MDEQPLDPTGRSTDGNPEIMRKHPAHGVFMPGGKPIIVFLTVCTKGRHPWLATPEIHAHLRSVWIGADAWFVGRYVVMPDHIHLFASPGSVGDGRKLIALHGPVDGNRVGLPSSPTASWEGEAPAEPSWEGEAPAEPSWEGEAPAEPSLRSRPSPEGTEVDFDNWVKYWKSQFTKQHRDPSHRWETDHWGTRIKRGESYGAKWEYVRGNPVRHGLVARVEDWPFQGEIHGLEWLGT